MYCKADIFYILFEMLNTPNPFTTDPGYWKICVVCILLGRALRQDFDEIKMDQAVNPLRLNVITFGQM